MDFDNKVSSGIIQDGKVLTGETADVKPVGRREQAGRLGLCLAPARRGQAPLNAWLYGSSGSGKTMLARWVINETCVGGSRVGVYVNCWQHRTLYSVLQAIVDQLKLLGADVQDTSVKLDRIRQALRGRAAVVILDEIDRPMPTEREEIIYGLLSLPNTGVVCVANDTRSLAMLDARVRSRLSPTLIQMPAYLPKEIQEILTDRARIALAPDSWSGPILKRIAEASNGDARWAVRVLHQAAAIAEQSGGAKISRQIVEQIIQQWQSVRSEERLVSLSEHERIIHDIAKQHAPIDAAELARHYVDHCRQHGIQPMARRTFSKYLDRLTCSGILEVTGRSRGASGRVMKAT